jgi:hypothetical protein
MSHRAFDNLAHRWRMAGLLLAILGVAMLLGGCEEEPGAVPPASVERVGTFVADPNEHDDADQQEALGISDIGDFDISDTTLPSARYVYFMHGSELWQIGQTGQPQEFVGDLLIGGVDASARGDLVAVLHFERDDDGEEVGVVSIMGDDGNETIDLASLADRFDIGRLSPIQTISMRPDGEALALTHQNGAMTLVKLEGNVQELLPSSIEHQPGRITWSTDGQFLAYLDPWMPDEPSSLFVTVPGRDIRLALMGGSDHGGIVRARWIPGTMFIAVVRSTGSTIAHGGDLFLVDADTGRRELLMSSGSIAPVAGIADIEPSPDGNWLAATGFVPGDEHPAFAGLWLIDLESGVSHEIDLEHDGNVTDLWWLGDNLLIRAIETPQTSLPGTYTGRESFRLLEIDPSDRSITQRYPELEDEEEDDTS